jgi:hypothetical protein
MACGRTVIGNWDLFFERRAKRNYRPTVTWEQLAKYGDAIRKSPAPSVSTADLEWAARGGRRYRRRPFGYQRRKY